MKRFIAVALLLTLFVQPAFAGSTTGKCCCPPCSTSRAVAKRTFTSAPSKIAVRRDTTVVHTTTERVIHYKPEPIVAARKCSSKWWIAGAAIAAGTAGYFIGKANGSDETTIVTPAPIIAPPCEDDDRAHR